MFAIVDIETTGGHAAENGITEICIILHNGIVEEGRYHTLINPQMPIPHFITALTGIDSYMLADAPLFGDVADKIFNLLNDRIFVAHNVNFDFSFVKHHLQLAGFELLAKKLCTVRYARKVKPGHLSYSLGKICQDLNIHIDDRHRAHGDAAATVELLLQIMDLDDGHSVLQQMTKGRNAEGYLPMHVPLEQLEGLPYCPGVYYFKNKEGKIIYVGKAINLRYRVRSHFSNNAANKRKQDFIRDIFSIDFKTCATELHALVLEAIEIKKIWPIYNRSQKRFEQQYGLYSLEDQNGLLRLAVEKKRKHLPALYSFAKKDEGMAVARKILQQYSLDEHYSFAFTSAPPMDKEKIALHNSTLKLAIAYLAGYLPSFAILQKGDDALGKPSTICFVVEKGKFTGMSFIDNDAPLSNIEDFKNAVEPYPDYDFIRSALLNYAERNPKDVKLFKT